MTYRMNRRGRGLFIIINNENFKDQPPRPGSNVDAASLQTTFGRLGFTCQRHDDKTCAEMVEIMKQVGRLDHKQFDCFACAILSHGNEVYLAGTDGFVEHYKLFDPVKGHLCPSLLTKPKLFFIQACRGNLLDSGAAAFDCVDGNEVSQDCVKVPLEADTLYVYSTAHGYFSWRHGGKGSYFIQALCRVLDEWGDSRELMFILTRVNHIVAYEFESNAQKAHMRKKKQIPSIVSQLTKRLYFPVSIPMKCMNLLFDIADI